MCCSADWKREVVQDHKWDFINVSEFHRTDFFTRFKYVFRYMLLFKSIAVMGLDIFTAITMISSDHWTNTLTQKATESGSGIDVQFAIAKWVFVGCIIFSFLLYGYEFYKAKLVIQSRDIAYAFTNLQANDYFSFKNYDNFCLFCHIENSTKRKDDLAFFVFFTFKDWKRLLLADGPRQSINALLLYSFGSANKWQTSDIPAWWDKDAITAMLLFSMIATVLIFAGSLILLIGASVMYIPLLCYIQGNLKEYVCVKVDKRLTELLRKKQRQRAQRAAALEKQLARDGGLRNSKGELVNVNLQPTLPSIKLDDDEMSVKGMTTQGGLSRSKSGDALSTFGGHDDYAYPPTLDYAPASMMYSAQSQDYGSSTRLTDAAGPMGISYPPPSATAPPSAFSRTNSGYNYNTGGTQGRMTPSRSGTQMSGQSGMSRSESRQGQGQYGLSGIATAVAIPTPTPIWSHGYPARRPSRDEYSHRISPEYPPSASATMTTGYPSSVPPISYRPNNNSVANGTGGYATLQPVSRASSAAGQHDRYAQQPPSVYSRTITPNHVSTFIPPNPQRQPGFGQAQPLPSPGLAYDQPDIDYTGSEGYDPAPSYHTVSPPRNQGHSQRPGQGNVYGHGHGHGYGYGNAPESRQGW